MKKLLLIVLLCCAGRPGASGQTYQGWVDSAAAARFTVLPEEEFTGETVVDSTRWDAEKPGMQVSFASTDRHYFRREVPDLAGTTHEVTKTGWKGERLNFMVLIWSRDTLHQVRVQARDLVDRRGRKISRERVRSFKVQYVLSNYPYAVDNVTCDAAPYGGAFLMPDRLVELSGYDRFDVPGRSVRPVWVSVEIPPDAAPASYRGTLEVMSDRGASVLALTVNVQQMRLPPPHDWKFRLDLWQNPWASAYFYNVRPWSDEHKLILRNHLRLYAEAGGKFITTYAVFSPWGDPTYRLEEPMVQTVRRGDGSWRFDYAIFDQYVQLAMEAGIDKAITIYTPIPWGNRFRYLAEQTGDYRYEIWTPGSREFTGFWHAFLSDLERHLRSRGWFDRVYLGINENELGQTLAAIRVIKEHSRKWRITYAGDWHAELDGLVDDYSSVFGKEPGFPELRARSVRGCTSTFYVCCTPPKPNTFVSSAPAEARWLGWYSASHAYDGLLRWAYDLWPPHPGNDARHIYWAAGDCFLVYPGAASSIRFEKLREGIADYEKIAALRARAARLPEAKRRILTGNLDALLQGMAAKRQFEKDYFSSSLREGEAILQELTAALARYVE